MMKKCIFLTLAVLAGCGKYDLGNDADFDTKLPVTPTEINVGSSQYNKIKEICDAITVKDVTLNSLVGQNYNFSQTNKKCDDQAFASLADTSTTLVNQGGQLKFSEGVNLAYFSEPETVSTGLIKEACNRLANLESPIKLDSVNLLYVTTDDIAGNDCTNVSFERCIKFQKATLETAADGTQQGKVHTREYIRVKTDTDKALVGFFSYRKLTSIGGCLEGKYFGRTATLK